MIPSKNECRDFSVLSLFKVENKLWLKSSVTFWYWLIRRETCVGVRTHFTQDFLDYIKPIHFSVYRKSFGTSTVFWGGTNISVVPVHSLLHRDTYLFSLVRCVYIYHWDELSKRSKRKSWTRCRKIRIRCFFLVTLMMTMMKITNSRFQLIQGYFF